MENSPAGLRSWHRTVIATVALPLVISLAVMAYAWPASRIAPRDLSVGVVGTSAASQKAVEALDHGKPGGFDFHLYPDQASARSAIKSREIYGAFVVTPGTVTVLETTAASTSVAQLLTTSGQRLAAQAAKLSSQDAGPSLSTHGGSTTSKDTTSKAAAKKAAARKAAAKKAAKVKFKTFDVVPISANDPRGVVFSSALLPLTMCSIAIAALIALSGGRIPVWRRLIDLFAACAVTGLAAYLIAQGLLGALPHEHVATWAALSLTMLAISATSVGLITLLGNAGLGLSAVLMVFVGNPFSGSTSAPELLPKAVADIGQWLPPGAGANLLRSTAYFEGNGSGSHVAVLVLWSALGLTTIVLGRRSPAVVDGPSAQDVAGDDGTSTESPAVNETATALTFSPAVNRPHAHARHAAHE
ncbi:ABC transporter permease [Streptomyces sp. NPDC058691]|uniref:ABC transporter permease n=1 Tax=Streptomyces sp. NPDC058691 TaxID=3346601 RepID=UPI00365F5133